MFARAQALASPLLETPSFWASLEIGSDQTSSYRSSRVNRCVANMPLHDNVHTIPWPPVPYLLILLFLHLVGFRGTPVLFRLAVRLKDVCNTKEPVLSDCRASSAAMGGA